MSSDEETLDTPSIWQEEGYTTLVLREVFTWLSGEELASVGAVCRMWRRVSSDQGLWRRLLLKCNKADKHCTRALLDVIDPSQWRQEYVNAHAPWISAGSLQVGAGSVLQHAALSPAGDRLAITTDDAVLSVWQQSEGKWQESWQCDLTEARGWASAARSDWAETGSRLLVAGPRALSDVAASWELLVLDFDEQSRGHMRSRARCGAGAGGCWARADGASFLSLVPALLAPGLSYTAVWLNAATQEIDSEYTGVRSRLLRIFNEENAHVMQTLVLDLPTCDITSQTSRRSTYFYAIRSECEKQIYADHRIFLGTWGTDNSGGLSAWSIPTSLKPVEVPPDGLAARHAARREQRRDPAPDPPPPTEEEVRALCDPPLATCDLYSRPLGMVLHPGKKCLWVTTSSGPVLCIYIPTLEPLQLLIPSVPTAPSHSFSHYVQPAASPYYVVTPAGSLSSSVHIWSTICRSHTTPCVRTPAPAVATLLTHDDTSTLLVVAGDTVYMWRNRATIQNV